MGATVAGNTFGPAEAVEAHYTLLLLAIPQMECVWHYSEQRIRLLLWRQPSEASL